MAGVSTTVDTGEDVNVTAVATPLVHSDINSNFGNMTNLTCTPNLAQVSTTVRCTGTLPAAYLPPTSGSLKLSIGSQSQVTCTFSGQTFTCSNVPVGSTRGYQNIYAAVGSGTPEDTGRDEQVVNTTLPTTGGRESITIGAIVVLILGSGIGGYAYYKKNKKLKVTKA